METNWKTRKEQLLVNLQTVDRVIFEGAVVESLCYDSIRLTCGGKTAEVDLDAVQSLTIL